MKSRKDVTDEILSEDYDQEIFIKHHLRAQLRVFRQGWLTEDRWKLLLHDKDQYNHYLPTSIFNLKTKCKYLAKTI